MLNERKLYKVKFTVKNKTKPQEELIEAPAGIIKTKDDAKPYLLPLEHDVDEIMSCYEQRTN